MKSNHEGNTSVSSLITQLTILAVLAWTTMYLTGCAWRMTITPIQSEELIQKSYTNKFMDWLFDPSKPSKEAK